MAVDGKCRAERAVEVKDKECRVLMKTMVSEGPSPPDPRLDQLSHHEAQQSVLILLQNELNDVKKKLEVVELEHQKDLLKVVEDFEVELRQKEYFLDSPIELAMENAFQSLSMNSNPELLKLKEEITRISQKIRMKIEMCLTLTVA